MPHAAATRAEHRVDGRGLGDVAMADHHAADLLRQRLDPLLERIALIGEGEFGALRMAGLGDAPGDRAVVGDPHDQAALAAHEARGFRHSRPRSAISGPRLLWHRVSSPASGGRRRQADLPAFVGIAGRSGNGSTAACRLLCRLRRHSSGAEDLGGFRQDVEAAIPALRRYARALTRDAETADDLVQDTLVRALRSEHLFHGGDCASWLYTILTNLNRNRLRSLARRPSLIADRRQRCAPTWRGRKPAAATSSARSTGWSRSSARAAAGRARRPHLPRGRRSAGRADRNRDVAARARAHADQSLSRRRAPGAAPHQVSQRSKSDDDRQRLRP